MLPVENGAGEPIGERSRRRTFARLTTFELACPECGTIDCVISARPWWRKRANGGRPVDPIPKRRELIGLRQLHTRGWHDPVNMQCECLPATRSSCPLPSQKNIAARHQETRRIASTQSWSSRPCTQAVASCVRQIRFSTYHLSGNRTSSFRTRPERTAACN